jgi:TorA maturation chaperone TorD
MLEARSRAYGLLARILLKGIDADSVGQVAKLPELLEGVPSPPDPDELAHEHHATFHLGAFPYAGVFLDAQAKAGAWADQVQAHYDAAGFRPRLDEVSADHLGVMLAFSSWATGAQGDAVRDGEMKIAARIEQIVAAFLEECVLSWLPSLVVAVEQCGSRFWTNVVTMALGLAADHRKQLRHADRPVDLGSVESPLTDERAGLRDIAEFLLTPQRSGVFLTGGDIAKMGREHDVPRGFGGRQIMLTNLLRSAVDLGELPRVLESLFGLLHDRRAELDALADASGLHGHVEPWRRRIKQTRGVVLELAGHAGTGTRMEPQAANGPV